MLSCHSQSSQFIQGEQQQVSQVSLTLTPELKQASPSSSLPFLHWYTSLVELDQVDWTGFYTIMLFPRTTILRKQSKSDSTL